MIHFSLRDISLEFSFQKTAIKKMHAFIDVNAPWLLALFLSFISGFFFVYFYANKLGLAYNDARSHLDIARRVVEGLKPGLAQLGSVWLPLPHILMIPTIWNDFMWHSGLSGGLVSMVSFVVTGLVIWSFLKMLGVGILGRVIGVLVFVANLNILYLQSIAMTELLLLATMTFGVYDLVRWNKENKIIYLVRSAFWIMLSTLIRYDGWFLLAYAAGVIAVRVFLRKGYKRAEGAFVLFCTLGGFGIFLWLLWNQLIFGDALYFAFGPFSAHAQQEQLDAAGVLESKKNLYLSAKIYWYALMYNSGAFTTLIGLFGAILLWFDKHISKDVRLASTALIAPLLFNILALYLGHSVLFIQGISGNTWFNARYGIMLAPSLAIFVGYLVHTLKNIRPVLIGLLAFITVFSFTSYDAVTIDDARVGSSQKNVSEVSGWLKENAANKDGFILISAASHDAIIFSSGLPMKRFIHEGTGAYWDYAVEKPELWARWIVLRTNDTNDLTFKEVQDSTGFADMYDKVQSFPFADIYQIQDQYVSQVETEAVFKQK